MKLVLTTAEVIDLITRQLMAEEYGCGGRFYESLNESEMQLCILGSQKVILPMEDEFIFEVAEEDPDAETEVDDEAADSEDPAKFTESRDD